MKKIAAYFVNNSFLVNLLTVTIIALGVLSLLNTKKGLAPPWEARRIIITANLDGASPSEVERFLTLPIEQAVKSHDGIETIRSNSRQGWVEIIVDIQDDHGDLLALEQKVKDSVNNLKGFLPPSVENLQVRLFKETEKWFSSYSLLNYNEQDDSHQAWMAQFKKGFNKIAGVNRVTSSSRVKQLYIKVDTDKMARYQVGLSDLYSKVRESFALYPIGSVRKGSNQYFVEVKNKKLEVEDIKNIILRSSNSGHDLRLGDVAEVRRSLSKREQHWYVNGKPSTYVTIMSSVNSDMLVLKEEVNKYLAEVKETMPKGIELILTGDGPAFLERQISALKTNSLFGIVLVIVVLLFFLGFRNALMTSIGLPLCYCFTFIILQSMGLKLDLISIVGMLLVLGILVDDAIIISEQYSQNLEEGLAPKDAAVKAVTEMWIPITGAILTSIAAFVPFLFGKDPMSMMLKGIPVVIVTALFISLFECFFILPNHLVHFVKKPQSFQSNFADKFKDSYSNVLAFFLKWRYPFCFAFVAFMGYSIYYAQKNIPTNFNLNISQEKVRMRVILNKTDSLEDSKKQLHVVDEALAKLDKSKFRYIENRIGRMWINGKEKVGPAYAFFAIVFAQNDPELGEKKEYIEQKLKDIAAELKKSGTFKSILVQRQKEGQEKNIEKLIRVNVDSYKPFEYNVVTEKLISELSGLKGVLEIDAENSSLIDSWQFTPDNKQLLRYGLSLPAFTNQLRAMISKSRVYEYRAEENVVNIYGYSEEGEKQTFEGMNNKKILLDNGKSVSIAKLGKWEKVKKYKSITHKDLKRRIYLDIPYDEKVLKKEMLIKSMKEKIATFSGQMPDLTISVQDADEQARKNKKTVGLKTIYALTAIFFILALILRSIVQPILICLAIPFGVIGIIWAYHFQGLTIDLMAFIGIIGMAGVVVNDSLILVNTINRKKRALKKFNRSIIIEGASSRLRPIILTSLTTLGGLFPMAYAIGGDAGFTKSMAMSMGWGILFATVLTLFLLPCFILIQADSITLSTKLWNLVRRKKQVDQDKESPISEETSSDTLIHLTKKDESGDDHTLQ
jgi:multidrug efflux pump subunit AcrB